MTQYATPVPETDLTPPRISVIIPAYNSSRTIERCLRALGIQETSHRFEVLVVHSGDDDTCARAKLALPGVRTIQLAERAIPPRSRNIGAQHARGEIFALIDSDIYVYPTWIDHVVKGVESGYDLLCGSIENANPHSAVSRAEQLLMFKEFMPDQPQHPSWFALSGNTVLSRVAYERFGPFAEVRAAEDIVFSRRLLAAGGRILFYPSLRVRHDNRTLLRPFLRNQLLVGKHTARARRLVRFADSGSYRVFLLSLPIAPLVKLAKIAIHLGRHNPWQARLVLKEFPLLLVGVSAYCIGLVQGSGSTDNSVGAATSPSSPNSKAPMSGAEPAQGR
jgi:glycosyltransferase involved in cell wall biosynthesis